VSFEVTINDEVFEMDRLDELRTHLVRLQENQFTEVWLIPSDGWPTLTALVNGSAAWLMYLRYEGDAGFSTRNPNYVGPEGAVVQYQLSNGQMDEYPASWNITTPEAVRALEHFFITLERPPWLTWHAH
jgi:hypothetical protein